MGKAGSTKKMAKKKVTVAGAKGKGHEKASIPEDQWNMPAGYKADRSGMATLKEVADPHVHTTLSFSELTPDQRAELVAKRIEMQPKFNVSMLGIGVIDKDRALAEVRAQSKAGRILTEIEQRLINDLLERAKGKTT